MGSSAKKKPSQKPPSRAQLAGHPGTLRRCVFRYLMPTELPFAIMYAYRTPGLPLYGIKQRLPQPLQIVVPL